MTLVFLALRRSIAALGRGRVWVYILVPTVMAMLMMLVLSLVFLDQLIASLIEQPPMSWMTAWGAVWVAHLFAALGGWALILSLCYLVAMLLTAVLVLPLMLKDQAAARYAELAPMGNDSFIGSLWVSLSASILFIAGWLVTLPLWLLPGLGLILPLFWMGWLNRRTFAYDVLAGYATPDEWRTLRQQHAWPLLALGLLVAMLAYVPFVGLIAPALAALAYVHYCLEALRRLRQGALFSVEQGPDSGSVC